MKDIKVFINLLQENPELKLQLKVKQKEIINPKEFNHLQEEYFKLKSQLQDARTKISMLEFENSKVKLKQKLMKNLEEMKVHYNALEGENCTLESQLKTKQLQLKDLNDTLASIQEECSDLKLQLKGIKSHANMLQEENSDLKMEVKDLKQILQKENPEVKSRLELLQKHPERPEVDRNGMLRNIEVMRGTSAHSNSSFSVYHYDINGRDMERFMGI